MKFTVLPCAVYLLLATACSASSGEGPPPSSNASTGSGSSSTGSGGTDASGSTGSGSSSTGSGGTINVPMGGTGGSGDVMNGECDQVNFESSRKPVEVLLVLDRSGSMTEHEVVADPALDVNGVGGVDRWEALAPSVSNAVMASDADISWGLKLFPTGTDESCSASTITPDIEIPIAPMNGSNLAALIGMTVADGNGTPTGEAINAGAAYLATLPPGVDRYMLLATDGDPSCPNDDGGEAIAMQALTDAFNAGFPTFVIGVLDEDGNPEVLNAMAIAGGRPRPLANPLANKFYLVNTEQELIDALASITGQIPSCVFPFENAPPDPTNIAVKVNGEKVERDESHTTGWDYTGDDYMGVELYGETCEAVKDASSNTIDMIFGCPGVPIK